VLQGDRIRLRQVRENDLERMYDFHEDISNRGAFYPVGVFGWPAFRERYEKTGFWELKEGLLLIVGDDDAILGHIEFFETVSYLDEIEIGYILYSQEHAGRGIATEAVILLTDYLFGRFKVNRIRLVIHPGNAASRRVAEKAGFSLEGVARGAWYHRGSNHDVEIWALLREEYVPLP
jgi:RimJ/RimL family protein N-acetyltransferase